MWHPLLWNGIDVINRGTGGIYVLFNILTFTFYGMRGLEMGQECRNFNFSLHESLISITKSSFVFHNYKSIIMVRKEEKYKI